MERQRLIKILSIVALVVAIVGMSLGFAAFSTTLNVSSGASVTPDSGDFNVVLCISDDIGFCDRGIYFINYTESNGAVAFNSAYLGGSSADELKGSFTKTNQSVTYNFYAQNIGEYDAYLRGITYTVLDNDSYKKCSASTTDETKATDSLIQAACDGIKVSVSVGGIQYELGDTNISGHLLSKGSVEPISFKIEYESGSALADGPFNVEIADIKFDYSTIDREVKIINFTIGGYSYQAEEGMTWLEWCNSDYNVDNFYITASGYVYASSNVMLNSEYVLSSDFISEAANYTFKSSGRPMPTPH